MNPSRPLLALAALLALDTLAGGEAPPSTRYAEPARLAPESLLIAIAAAGERLVAAGDRGIIVLSDDHGRSWTQATRVPTQALLTGVCFFDPLRGIAVGHDEVILTTADAGRTWSLTHDAPAAERPLLDVWCGAAGEAIAVGAYSTYLTSVDRGAHWSARGFAPAPPDGARHAASSAAAAAGGGFHLNRIVGAEGSRLYVAGEAGHLYRSDDRGDSWRELPSPYAGSFFDILPLGAEALLAFGLRGNLFRSDDGGATWRRLETGTGQMLDGGALLPGGTLAIVGLGGVVLASRDRGASFTLEQQADRSGLSAAVAVGSDALAVVGEGGARIVILGRGAGGGVVERW